MRRHLSLAIALLVAVGIGGCEKSTPLALELLEDTDSAAFLVTNQTSQELRYSQELLASPLAKRKDGDFYLVVEDSGRPLNLCGMVDAPIPQQASVAPAGRATFRVYGLAPIYCLADGKPYTLSVQYTKFDSQGKKIILHSSNRVSFVAKNDLTSHLPVRYE